MIDKLLQIILVYAMFCKCIGELIHFSVSLLQDFFYIFVYLPLPLRKLQY